MARPLAFDPEEKLRLAVDLFWKQGYEATSLQNLVETLGINRFSLYNTFGDKRALFDKALKHYQSLKFDWLMASIQPVEEGLPSLKRFLLTLKKGLEMPSPGGCLLQNTALEGSISDPETLDYIQGLITTQRTAISDALQHAIALEQFRHKHNSDALADMILAQVQGAVALSRIAGPSQATRSVDALLTMIDTW